MACPPGRIQIRRDTLEAWTSTNPVLYPGELGFAFPNGGLGYPNGIIRIGKSGAGSSWANSIQVFPTTGGGGGGAQGPTGAQGYSACEIIPYAGEPTSTYIFSNAGGGYTLTINTASNDQLICVNPEIFNVNTIGVAFTCTLPNTASYSGTKVHIGFGFAYAVIGDNTIGLYADGTLQNGPSIPSYTPGSTLTIAYNGVGSVIFTIVNGETISTNSYTTTATIEYGYIGYQAIPTAKTTTITNANYYTLGLPGLQGPTGPIYAPTTLQNIYNITILSTNGSLITISPTDMVQIMATNQQIRILFNPPLEYTNITSGETYRVYSIDRSTNEIQITSGSGPITPTS